MKFPPSILDDIKARLPASTVVGRRVRLTKAGREWKGLSPFGKEKTPSFFVNDVKQAWFDFSSGRNGDIFKFVMETEGLSFPEAVERLAAEAGVILPRISEDAVRHEEERKGLFEVIELAAAFFEAELRGPRGVEARRYLEGRALWGDPTCRFRLGYAPAERFALRDHLAGKGIPAELMIEAGLLIHGDDIAVPYDRFRDRVMFPIADVRGRVIAFGGRALSPDAPAKYLNTAETGLFHKGRLLYNHHVARKAAHDAGQVIAVEGYVDVIAMTLAGFAHAVAPLGTALTEDQLALLWRMADEPTLCFDGDKAGRKAAWRAIDIALPLMEPGKSLKFALLPEGQDPDDLLRSGGPEAVGAVLAAARPLVDLIWSREIEAAPLDTPERRAAFERRLGQVLSQIRDEATRRHYRDEMDARLAALFPRQPARGRRMERRDGPYADRREGSYQPRQRAAMTGGLSSQPLRASPALARSAIFATPGVGDNTREATVLIGLAAHPAILAVMADELAEADWQGHSALRLCQALLQAVVDGESTAEGIGRLMASPAVREAHARLERLVRPSDRARLAHDADPHAVSDMIRQALVLHRRARTLHSELKAAERAFSDDASEDNLAWLLDVKGRLSSLEGTEATSS
ncbi:MAG: DNA primase [Bosea sp.]|jgi:DNA primase|nr:DNA primase [Bosea sp. (in: a-proteobacteria)]